MLSTFSRTVPSNVYEAWILLSVFVSCFMLHLTGWNRIPQFLAQLHYRSIYFRSFNVSSLLLISQSSAKRLISNSISKVISLMCKENKKGPRIVSCGTPETTGNQSDLIPFTLDLVPIYTEIFKLLVF